MRFLGGSLDGQWRILYLIGGDDDTLCGWND